MRRSSVLSLCIWMLSTRSVYAIDLLPGEAQAPRAGINYLQLIYQQSERGDYYRDGRKSRTDARISASQFQMRLGRTFEIDGQPAFASVLIPLDMRTEPKGALSNVGTVAGVGDLTAYLAYWPYANRETQTYFGTVAYVTAPTGAYDRYRALNPGGNRWSGDIQMGYQQTVWNRLIVMVAGDVFWYGKNKDYGQFSNTLEQKPIYSTQASLRYDLNSFYAIGASYFINAGGETSVNGIANSDRLLVRRYQLVGSVNCSFGRVILQYGGDLRTNNGYFENSRWLVRYIRPF